MNGMPQNKADECEYKENDRRQKEQFINSINNDEMMTDITLELTSVKKTSEVVIDPGINLGHKDGSAERTKSTDEATKTAKNSIP